MRACVAVAIGLAIGTGFAQPASGKPPAPLRVVVTIQPLALLLHELGGHDLELHVLVPPGASPHAFEPRPSDLVRIAGAELFMSIGGGLDDWAARLAEGAGEGLANHDLFSRLERRPAEAQPSADEHHHTLESDPHLWLDPREVREHVAPVLSDLLIEIDPEREAQYRERLARFRDELEALDREIAARLAVVSRDYLAFHNAWLRFAARYALNEVGVVEEAAGEQPTPREFAALVRAARRSGVGAVLIEPQFDPRLAETLGRSFGGVTVIVDPLGDPEDPRRSTYAGLLRFNAEAFRSAFETNRSPRAPGSR